jgi:hypothetical protein
LELVRIQKYPNLSYGVRTLKRENNYVCCIIKIPFLFVQLPLSCVIFCDVSLSLQQKHQELDKKIEKEKAKRKDLRKKNQYGEGGGWAEHRRNI